MTVSVIIPVYNTAPYLSQCVDSVLDQGMESMEIILVDDGSTDESPQICDAYANQHANIHVVHQKNEGLSAARNAGVQTAQGDYVVFLDSDDWWNPKVSVGDMLEKAKENPQTDMILISSLEYLPSTGLVQRKDTANLSAIDTTSPEKYYRSLLAMGNLQVSAGTKILQRDFLLKNNLLFQEGLLGEDNWWMMQVLRKLKHVAVITEPLYCMRMRREGSITNTIGLRNVRDMLRIVGMSRNDCEQGIVPEAIRECELSFDAYLWYCALALSRRLTKDDRESLYPLFRENIDVCQYGMSGKTRMAGAAVRLFGVKTGSRILGTYLSLHNRFRLNTRTFQEHS